MNRQRFIFLILMILPMYWCMDGFLITSIKVHPDVGTVNCTGLSLSIDGKDENPHCENGVQIDNQSYVTLTYNNNETKPITDLKNITLSLSASVILVFNQTTTISEVFNYTGVFIIDTKSDPNKLLVGTVTLNKEEPPVTTTKKTKAEDEKEDDSIITSNSDVENSKTATLTVNYIHLKYNENATVVKKTNGGAVAVAIIEGIALIAILAYMGYRTMVKHRMKETTMNAAMYGYDNNSRITVPDSIRMSDIPPPRDPTYATPPTPTVQPTITPSRNTALTTQELMVPTSAVSPTRPNSTTTTSNQQFRDPFDTLENW